MNTRHFLTSVFLIPLALLTVRADLSWTTETAATGITNTSTGPALTLGADGTAGIAYFDGADGSVNYAGRSGSGVWTTDTGIATRGTFNYLGLSVKLTADGDPRIGFFSVVNFEGRYASRTSDTWTVEDVVTDGAAGEYIHLGLASDGTARVSYGSNSNSLNYASRASGSWANEPITSNGIPAFLRIGAGDVPFIAFVDSQDTGDLRIASNPTGSSWVFSTAVSGFTGTSSTISFRLNGSDAAISWVDNGALKLARSTAGVWAVETVVESGVSNSGTSLALDGLGACYIAYLTDTNVINVAHYDGSAWVSDDFGVGNSTFGQGEWLDCRDGTLALAYLTDTGTLAYSFTSVPTGAVLAPVDLGDQSQKAGSSISLSLVPSGAPAGLTYHATGLPAGLTLNATTGALTGTITATPGPYSVTYWTQSGETQSTLLTLTWTVAPFPSALQGKYEGIFVSTADPVLPIAKLEITVTNTGAFTGRLTQGTPAITSVSGQLTLDSSEAFASLTSFTDGAYTVRSLKVSTNAGAKLTAKLRKGSSTTTLGTLSDGVKLKTFTSGSPAPWKGTYTAAFTTGANLDPATEDRSSPTGASYTTGSVSTNGTLSLKGKLADGTPITGSFASNSTGSYRLFVQPYSTANTYFAGWIKLTEWATSPSRYRVATADGQDFYWRKTANSSDTTYPKGFGALALNVRMATWLAPTTDTSLISLLALSSTDASALSLTASGAGLTSSQRSALAAPARLTLKNNLNVTDPAKALLWPSLNLATSSGKLTGSLLVQDTDSTSRTTTWEGVLLQLPPDERNTVLGRGFFVLPPVSGSSATPRGGSVSLSSP